MVTQCWTYSKLSINANYYFSYCSYSANWREEKGRKGYSHRLLNPERNSYGEHNSEGDSWELFQLSEHWR